MKVLFDVQYPYAWAVGGGVQVLVNNLMRSLKSLGVAVEPVNWWDESQTGDIVSTFNWPGSKFLFARKRGMGIVSYILLDEFSARTRPRLFLDTLLIHTFKRFLRGAALELGWCYSEISDAFIYPSRYDAVLGNHLFDADLKRSFVILHGVPDEYFVRNGERRVSKDYLISVGRITESKNTILLAKIAKAKRVPVLFLGRPLSNAFLLSNDHVDRYFAQFLAMVDQQYVMYKGFVSEEEKLRYLKESRGFVLLSKWESGCIAALEALAADKPVFLPDYRWAKETYGGYVRLGHMADPKQLSDEIEQFYHEGAQEKRADRKKFPVLTWEQVAKEYLQVYERVLEVRIK